MERKKVKRKRFVFCTYQSLIDQFREQSYRLNLSMSERIEKFIVKELEKEKKNED